MIKEHTHKFRRHTYETGSKIYFCTLPKCNKKIKVGLALGKESICWRCGKEFVMNEYSVRLAKPHCEDCHKSKVESNGDIHIERTVIPDFKSTLPTEATGVIGTSLLDRLRKVTKIEEDEEL